MKICTYPTAKKSTTTCAAIILVGTSFKDSEILALYRLGIVLLDPLEIFHIDKVYLKNNSTFQKWTNHSNIRLCSRNQ